MFLLILFKKILNETYNFQFLCGIIVDPWGNIEDSWDTMQ